MLRKLLIAVNVIASLIVVAIAFDMRWRYASPQQYFGVALFVLFPLMNAIYLWERNSPKSRWLLGLYIERRRLEEQALIEKLQHRAQ